MLLVGHRGARGEAPENTLAGFAHARAVGVDALELDVRLSADDQLVVVHDETVDRTTSSTGRVADLNAAALGRLDARGSCPTWPEPVGIPTLVAVFERFGASGRFAIEIKRDASASLARIVDLLLPAIEAHDLASRVVVTSFEPEALELVRRRAPGLELAYIGAYDRPAFLETALRLGCAQADVPVATGSSEVVREAQRHGLRVCGWLGNTPEVLRTLREWGVDAVTTDFPTMARAELAR